MSFKREKIKDFYLLSTDVENIFINEYMPEAPGDYVKVYLYGLLYSQSQSVEDAQQRAAFLVLPIVLLIVGQLAGVLLIDLWILLILGCVFAVIALILLKKAMGKFSYERFLQ